MAPAFGLLVCLARLASGGSADRERLAATLERVSLVALGLPPRATLVLGRVVAPAPLARDGSSEPFVRRLEESLRRRAANARRGRAGGDGSDWLFEDEEALEVALVAAWLDRTPSAATLLRMIANSGAPEPRIRWRRAIFTDGERAARTIARLAEAGLAAPWLAGFETSELKAATARVQASYGSVWSAADAALPGAAGSRSATSTSRPPATADRVARTLRALAPEAEILPPRAPARLLLLTALAARRRPALLTLPEAVEALWLAAEGLPSPAALTAPTDAPMTDRYSPGNERVPISNATQPTPSPPRSREQPILARAAAVAHPPLSKPIPPWSAPVHLEQPPICRTSFGGLLFLLNVFIALGLWGDFTRPRDGLPGLSPFELLLLLGRNWYGRACSADPLHARLRELVGLRRDKAPGGHFAAPEWSVPTDWLTPWPGARRRGGTWHAAGFPLSDSAYERRSPAMRRRYSVAALARYLAARLAVAVGIDDPAAGRDLVCRRKGELTLSTDALVLQLSLHDHPLQIRFAGLDRNPGRLAGTDRPVSFEFLG